LKGVWLNGELKGHRYSIWSSPLLTLCCRLTAAKQRQRSKFNFPCSSQRGLQTENCFYAAAAAVGAFDALALLLDCSYMALVRGGPETEAQPLSNTKHQTPKQQNRKPCSIRGPN